MKIFILLVMVYYITLFCQSFDNPQRWSVEFNNSTSSTICGDFNGDFKSDVGWNSGNGHWKIMLSDYTQFCPSYSWSDCQEYNAGIWVGDFNGDSFDDKITYVVSPDPDWQGFWIALSKRNPSGLYYEFSNERRWLSEQIPDFTKILIGDINGDALSDIIYYDPVNLKLCARINNGGNEELGGSFSPENDCLENFYWPTFVYTGDFNGDGKCDLFSYSDSKAQNNLYISNGISFELIGHPSNIELSNDKNFNSVGDFNGDGKSDITYYRNNMLYVAISEGTNFNVQVWKSVDNLNFMILAGDFSGDGKSDILNLKNPDYWDVYLSHEEVIHEVGVWYFPSYTVNLHREPPQLWANDFRDPNKIPVVGWGDDTLSGIYSCQDSVIVEKQIKAMRDVYIDFVIADITNGIASSATTPNLPNPPYPYPNNPSYYGDGFATNGTNCFLNVLKKLSLDNPGETYPRLAVGLGFEFWGKHTQCSYSLDTSSWSDQLVRQQYAANYVYDQYYLTYTNNYYLINNRPLLVITFGGLDDYPFRNGDYIPDKRNIFSQFVPKYGCEWRSTYAGFRDIGDNICVLQQHQFIEGIDTKGFWGFGGGQTDESAGEINPLDLPYSPEIMSIMPGTTKWNDVGDPVLVDRRRGDYYIKSWKQVIKNKPKRVLIGAWNNWNEELCIENCKGSNGWVDHNNNLTYDFYLKITKKYAYIFKEDQIEFDTYVREEDDPTIFYYDSQGNLNIMGNNPPNYQPVIELPKQWLLDHNYFPVDKLKKMSKLSFEVYPNPFNPSASVEVNLPENDLISIKLFNILGENIYTVVEKYLTNGNFKFNLNMSRHSSGIYFLMLNVGEKIYIKKIQLIK